MAEPQPPAAGSSAADSSAAAAAAGRWGGGEPRDTLPRPHPQPGLRTPAQLGQTPPVPRGERRHHVDAT